MSRQSDVRWVLVQWAKTHGHNIDECISLVDAVEDRTDNIEYAETETEKEIAIEMYQDMKDTVKLIFEKINTALTRESRTL